jgi:hypothetical protein
MTPEQEERIVCAFERISEAFDFMAGTIEAMEQRQAREFSLRYPSKRQPEPATVSHVKTSEENLRENQGQTGEKNLRDWSTLDDDEGFTGPREAAWLKVHPNENKKT